MALISRESRKEGQKEYIIVVAGARLKRPVYRLGKGDHVVVNEQVLVLDGVHGIEGSLRLSQMRAHDIKVSQLDSVGVLQDANKAGE